MDEEHQAILMNSAAHNTYTDFQDVFNQHPLILAEESYYDYELLKTALSREDPCDAIVNFLLKAGCRVRNPNRLNSEDTPLHLAMRGINCQSVIRRLLKNGASIYDKNHNGETPLYVAFKLESRISIDAVFYYYKSIEKLKSSLISLNPANKDDILHFHIACIFNNVRAVKLYLKCGFDVNSRFGLDFPELYGATLLHHAVIANNIKLFECLLQHGADISIKNDIGHTILHILYYLQQRGDANTLYPEMIRQVFRHGNNTKFINCVDNNGISHFHICCSTNFPDKVQVFIERGADINSTVPLCNTGLTPLHFAVFNNREKIVSLLLKNGADCNRQDKGSFTPLHLACNSSSPRYAARSIKILLEHPETRVFIADEYGRTPLHVAFDNQEFKDGKIIDILLSKIPREINFSDSRGLTHFHIACTRNDTSWVEDFIKSGVDVNSCVTSGNYRGYAPLHFAALHNQKNVIEILLKYKAQVNIKESESLTALHIMCQYFNLSKRFFEARPGQQGNVDWISQHRSRIDSINLLLLHGADVNAKTSLGKTPLLYACTYQSMENTYLAEKCHSRRNFHWDEIDNISKDVVQALLSNGANINARTDIQRSILHIITENRYLKNAEEFLEFCINQGADVHAADNAGITPLHMAVELRNRKFVQIFLQYKANINAKSNDLKIPIDFLLNDFRGVEEEKKICILLLEKGSDVNNIFGSNSTLTAALETSNSFLIQKLLNYGADISMEDSSGNPLIVPVLIRWQSETFRALNIKTATVFVVIFIHILVLVHIGFYINEKVWNCCLKLREHYKSSFLYVYSDKFLNDILCCIIQELSRMRLVKIDCTKNESLYSILSKGLHEFSKCVKNNTLVNLLEDRSINIKFPFYRFLLKMQFKKGLIRSKLLDSASASLSSIVGFNLPYLCCNSIFKYLTNEEIANVKAAGVRGKRRFKRKINNTNDSCKMEPPEKLHRRTKQE